MQHESVMHKLHCCFFCWLFLFCFVFLFISFFFLGVLLGGGGGGWLEQIRLHRSLSDMLQNSLDGKWKCLGSGYFIVVAHLVSHSTITSPMLGPY